MNSRNLRGPLDGLLKSVYDENKPYQYETMAEVECSGQLLVWIERRGTGKTSSGTDSNIPPVKEPTVSNLRFILQ